MNIAGISALYYAADMGQAGAALGALPEAARFPIDVGRLSHECGRPPDARLMPSEQHLGSEAGAILEDWAAHARVAAENQ